MKILSLLLSIFLSFQCMKFEESALDPRGTANSLTTISRLLGLQSAATNPTIQNYAIEFELKKADNTDYAGFNLEYQSSVSTTSTRATESTQPSTKITRNLTNPISVTIGSLGKVVVTLPGSGKYEFRILDASGIVVASFTLEIPQNFDPANWASLKPAVVSGDLVASILSVVLSTPPDTQYIFNASILESTDNKIFVLTNNVKWVGDLANFQLRLNVSTDGTNFTGISLGTNPYLQYTFSSAEGIKYFYKPTNLIKTGVDQYFFIIQVWDSSSTNPILNTHLGVHVNGTAISDVYPITPRSTSTGALNEIDMTQIFYVSGKLVYGERIQGSDVRTEFRTDTNFLRDGSTNARVEQAQLPNLNPVGNLFFNSSYVFAHKGGLVYGDNFSQQSYLYTTIDLANQYPGMFEFTLSANRIGNFVIAGNNQIYHIQYETSPTVGYDVEFSRLVSFPNPFDLNLTPEIDGTPVVLNLSQAPPFHAKVYEFGDSHLIPYYITDGIQVIAGTGIGFQAVNFKTATGVPAEDNLYISNFNAIGTNIYYIHTQHSVDSPPKYLLTSSSDGVTWSPLTEIQFPFE